MVFDLGAFLREAPRLFEQAPIQVLQFEARHLTDLSPLAQSPWLARIVRLEFSLGGFGARQMDQLLDSPNAGWLRELVFRFNGVNAEGLARLLASPPAARLRVLGLSNNFFVEHGLPSEAAFQDAVVMPELEELDLSSNRIQGMRAIRPLLGRRLTSNLRKLTLTDNPLADVGVVDLARCRSLTRLEELNLSATDPLVEGVEALFEASFAPGLRVLRLAGDRLGPVAMKRLAASTALAGLRVLDLGDNPLKDKGASALACSPHLGSLLSLDMRRAGVTDSGARAVLDSPTLAGLIHCDLHDNTLSRPLVQEVRERFGRFSASDPEHARARKPPGKKK
jgi:Ran GTPase-activating protein (RanGAP) involved in mRNA processing and transport